jgi:N-methylhydantoinase A
VDSVTLLGSDIGGTFTDVVLLARDGTLRVDKRLSTVEDYSRAVVNGMRAVLDAGAVSPSAVVSVGHGTTVATNAILERRGAVTALITTEGFRDVLEIGRLRVPRLYDTQWDKPRPLVPRRLRFEVPERIAADGRVIRPLDRSTLAAVVARLRALGVQAVAVCLLNAYRNGAHEEAIKRVLLDALPGVAVSTSSEVLPEIKEFERTSTTVTDAYVKPTMRRYLQSLDRGLRGIGVGAPLFIMQSNGGVLDLEGAAERPVFAIESGPAAGVIATRWLAERVGLKNVIAFDMGGTTAKAAIIEGGEISYAPELEIGGEVSAMSRLVKGGGYLIRTPVIDIAEVGAGGGSIARVDADCAGLRVGPDGAGAMPGPVCYGRGGVEPTVTDANVVLGYINPERIAGGAVRVHGDAAWQAIREKVAGPLDLDARTAAYGVYLIANATMARAIRAVSTERGRDVRSFSLVAFGGSGPIHAAALAREFQIPTVIVPQFPGLFSALGQLFADLERHWVRTVPGSRVALSDEVFALFTGLEEAAADAAARAPDVGGVRTTERFMDLRYQGQGHELRVPVAAGERTETVLRRFADEHRRLFGHDKGAASVEVVNLRLVSRVRNAWATSMPRFTPRPTDHRPGRREAFFGAQHGALPTAVLTDRGALGRDGMAGPLIIEEYDTTIVVPPDFAARLDAMGNVCIEMRR